MQVRNKLLLIEGIEKLHNTDFFRVLKYIKNFVIMNARYIAYILKGVQILVDVVNSRLLGINALNIITRNTLKESVFVLYFFSGLATLTSMYYYKLR